MAQCFFCCSHRESLSQTQDLTETTGEESEDHRPHADHDHSNHTSYFDMLSPESIEARPPRPLTSNFGSSHSTHGRHGQASTSPANSLVSATLPKSQPGDSDVTPLQDIETGADIIRRALLRSSRARREVKVENTFALTKQSDETERETQEGFRSSNTLEKEESVPNQETLLLNYDAQWCWVESQDDVTFL